MKYVVDRPYADPEKAARKLLEIANATEELQAGRIHIEAVARDSDDRSRAGSFDLALSGPDHRRIS
jgi:hypothetical protein